jgi:hypothetical protein
VGENNIKAKGNEYTKYIRDQKNGALRLRRTGDISLQTSQIFYHVSLPVDRVQGRRVLTALGGRHKFVEKRLCRVSKSECYTAIL